MIYRKKILNNFKKYYTEEKSIHRDINIIRKFFDIQPKEKYIIDDQCFYDLDMENVYHKIDRSYSSVGEAVLYKMLREPIIDETILKERNIIINKIKSDKELRAKIQYIFHNLGFDKKNRFLDMTNSELKSNKIKGILYSLFGFTNIALIILTCITLNKYIAFSVLILFIIAPGIEQHESKMVNINGLIYLNNMLNCAKRIISLDKDNKLSTTNIQIILKKLSNINLNTKLINMATKWGGILEPLMVPFLILESSYYRVIDKLKENKNDLLKLYYELGKLESYISIGIYQEIMNENISNPVFIKETMLEIKDGIHPLISKPIKNSISIDKKGILLTGTNMSGKSTFLRMIGINSIFAQTFYFTLSSKYKSPLLNIVTSISPKDDVNTGKSYYLAEIESILRIIKSLDNPIPSLCIIDEIFKGTNPIERISSSTAILNYINKSNAITFVATHDKELTTLLSNNYDFYYFSENINKNTGLSFDYKLKHGVVKSRNAIKLLKYVGYPDEIVNEAINLSRNME